MVLIGLRIGVSFILLSSLFKILHFNYSFELLLSGSIITLGLYIARTALKVSRIFADWVKLALVFSFCLRSVINIGHLSFAEELKFGLALIQFVALAFLYFTNNLPRLFFRSSHTFLNIQLGLGLLLMLIGIVFKIMHWPGASISLVFGVLLMILWMILEPIINRKTHFIDDPEILLDDFTELEHKDLSTPETSSHSLIHLSALGLVVIGLILKFFKLPGAGVFIVFGLVTGLFFVFRRK